MRTKVVSWESAAVTELFGVLHVPQLDSLWVKKSEKGVPVSRGTETMWKILHQAKG